MPEDGVLREGECAFSLMCRKLREQRLLRNSAAHLLPGFIAKSPAPLVWFRVSPTVAVWEVKGA